MGRALIRDHSGTYQAVRPLSEQDILKAAEHIIQRRFRRLGSLSNPKDTLNFLHSQLIHCEEEVFGGLFLDNCHRVIAWEVMFTGSIDSCSVYARVVVKQALRLNASAVIFAHHHPSGNPKPSEADRKITLQLRDALATIEVRVLDHLVIGAQDGVSLAERGLI